MRKIFIILAMLVAQWGYSQEIYQPLIDRYNSVDYIFEGQVIQTHPYLTANGGNIYTSNVIQIFKVFKGNISCGTIEMITDGGMVGDLSMSGSHSLMPVVGDIGIFLTSATTKELPAQSVYTFTNTDKMGPTYEWQSFIKYQFDNTSWSAYDLWQTFSDLNDLYNLTDQITGLQYIDCGAQLPTPPHQSPPAYMPDSMPHYDQATAQAMMSSLRLMAGSAHQTSSRSSAELTYSLHNQRITGVFPQYLEFDVSLTDPTSSGWFWQGLVYLQYDTAVYGDSVVANGNIQVTRGTVITSSADYQQSIPLDDASSGQVDIPIQGEATAQHLYQLNGTPTPLLHIKMRIRGCLGNDVKTVTPGGFLSLYSDAPTFDSIIIYPVIHYTDDFYISCQTQILSFDPSTVNGGVGDTLSIFGTRFGAIRGTGNLYFYDADHPNTGMSVALEDSDFVLWSDTLIQIILPSVEDSANGAVIGSGTFRVVTNSQQSSTTANALSVYYSLTNFRQSNHGKWFDYLYNTTGSGGYTFFADTSISHKPAIYGCVKKAIKDWVCATGVNFVLLRDTFGIPRASTRDSINIITLGHQDASAFATCYSMVSYCSANNIAIKDEMDIIISDDPTITWFTDTTGRDTLPVGQSDLYHVLLHEFGHGVGHNHVIDSTAIMYYKTPHVPNGGLPANQREVVLYADNSAVDGGLMEVEKASTATSSLLCGLLPMVSITTGHCFPYYSIDNLIDINSISLYPMPFDSKLQIKSESPIINISLTSLEGLRLDQWNIKDMNEVTYQAPKGLALGVYLITIQTVKGTTIVKVIYD